MISHQTSSSLTLSVIALSVLLPSAPSQAPKTAATQPLWFDDFVAAEAKARQSKRPILVYAFDSI
jgi:hypothetical protein